eukprot:5882678-Karenia_brevis.AAC.1
MLRREQFPPVPLPPLPSLAIPDDVVTFDDLITGSFQAADVTASAFDPIPGPVPENPNAPGTEPDRAPQPMH